jgi:hypothetical protein
VTAAVCVILGIFLLYPAGKSSFQVYSETKKAKKELQETSERKQILTNLSQSRY